MRSSENFPPFSEKVVERGEGCAPKPMTLRLLCKNSSDLLGFQYVLGAKRATFRLGGMALNAPWIRQCHGRRRNVRLRPGKSA